MVKLLQLKIRLEGIKPEIWRRFIVEDSISFKKLHKIVQEVMGWEDYHLYDFDVDGVTIGDPSIQDEFEGEDSRRLKLAKLLKSEKQKFHYMYDYGDSWAHTIIVEKILDEGACKEHPFCIAGERACPPEDCGGVGGYKEFLKAIGNKGHKEHEEMLEWIGGSFDSEKFDLEKANKSLQRL